MGPNNATLPPVRYHIFKNKLPYPTGLKLQSAILDARFKARETGGGKTDSLFLLGESLLRPADVCRSWLPPLTNPPCLLSH